MLIWPLRSIGMIVAWAQRATTAAGRVFEILDTSPGIADHAGREEARASTGGDVRYEDVQFAYPDGGPVLDGVTLDIPAGTSVALVGQTGCGKSTLMRLLPRFIEPVDGDVTIDGQDVSAVTLSSLRAQIGIVFEDTLLFSDSIASNIAFGRPDATRGGDRPRRGRSRRRTSSSRSSPRATTPSSASTATRSRAGSVSASRSRARY